MTLPTIATLFDLKDFEHKAVFNGLKYPWDILDPGYQNQYIRKVIKPNLDFERNGSIVKENVVIYKGKIVREGLEFKSFRIARGSSIKEKYVVFKNKEVLEGATVIFAGAYLVGNEIEIGEGCRIEEGAYIVGPAILGPGTEVRQGAYLRGEIITGKKAVIGHATEVKSSIFLNDAKAPHFAYVGDSVLGNSVNLGAGTKVSNLKITGDEIVFKVGRNQISTGLRKFGALIGDGVETGCNSVLNPGVVLGKGSMVYPCVSLKKGFYPPKSLIKGDSVERLK